eukprot:scaffold75978_cov19-Tisochrysis_lutea.AAC.2
MCPAVLTTATHAPRCRPPLPPTPPNILDQPSHAMPKNEGSLPRRKLRSRSENLKGFSSLIPIQENSLRALQAEGMCTHSVWTATVPLKRIWEET